MNGYDEYDKTAFLETGSSYMLDVDDGTDKMPDDMSVVRPSKFHDNVFHETPVAVASGSMHSKSTYRNILLIAIIVLLVIIGVMMYRRSRQNSIEY